MPSKMLLEYIITESYKTKASITSNLKSNFTFQTIEIKAENLKVRATKNDKFRIFEREKG